MKARSRRELVALEQELQESIGTVDTLRMNLYQRLAGLCRPEVIEHGLVQGGIAKLMSFTTTECGGSPSSKWTKLILEISQIQPQLLTQKSTRGALYAVKVELPREAAPY